MNVEITRDMASVIKGALEGCVGEGIDPERWEDLTVEQSRAAERALWVVLNKILRDTVD